MINEDHAMVRAYPNGQKICSLHILAVTQPSLGSLDDLRMSSLAPRRKNLDEWMPNKLWNQVKRYMPIPCVDVIIEDSRGEVLLG